MWTSPMSNTSKLVLAGALLALPLAAPSASSDELPVIAEPVPTDAEELSDKERCGDPPIMPDGVLDEQDVIDGLIKDLSCLEFWLPRRCYTNPA